MNITMSSPLRIAATAALAGGLLAVGPLTPGSAADRTVAAEPATAQQARTSYRWPLDGQVVLTRPFDPPLRRWLSGHRGVDLDAPAGTVVRAAGHGTVFFAGPVADRPVVSVQHADGLRTTYEPVVPLVAVDDDVRAGDPIGVLLAGHPGCAGPACLHWGLRRDEHYLDPLLLVGGSRARLLPR